MTTSQIIANVWKIFQLQFKQSECQLYLVGSRARKSHRSFSDFDFVIKHKKNKSIHKAKLSKFKSAIEELKTLYTIDIVDYYDASVDFQQAIAHEMRKVVNGKISSKTFA